MLKGDVEIHFLDRTVDHPITAGKLMPSTSPVWPAGAARPRKAHKRSSLRHTPNARSVWKQVSSLLGYFKQNMSL